MGKNILHDFSRTHLVTLLRNLSVKRSLTSAGNNEHEALLSNHKKRHVTYRVTVYSLNDQKQVSTGFERIYMFGWPV
jgi:hypothetical protein